MPNIPQRLSLGQLLRQAREQRRLSLDEAAAQLRSRRGTPLSPQTLHDYERNRTRPTLTMLMQLCTLYRLDLHVMVGAWMVAPRRRPREA
jgi:transcriptional regulator with XRE-family HTH domain